ncbi:hypothetical protein BMI91_06860 [Thioclava sediminum]|uniref:HEPN AbiU2-like domain-containing protein n=1 Tax=Thioclava sediminum TaxID=1915319 RepID=A0ABX3N2A8_9RHOB|nr:hypothetical protein [Thioclava sediminum]OOY26092.1 hypothetical protein BMI91_06860 [Thioclava sediminum]
MEMEEYFGKLRENLVYADLSLMQLRVVSIRLSNRTQLPNELRVNLEVQEQALKDMLVLGLARLFDKKGSKSERISIPNILGNDAIALNEDLKIKLNELMRAELLGKLKNVRDKIVAHSLSDAFDVRFQMDDAQNLIDRCYDLLTEIFHHNKPHERLARQDLKIYVKRWHEMTKAWE